MQTRPTKVVLFRPVSSPVYRQGEIPVQLLAIARMLAPKHDVRIVAAELGLVRKGQQQLEREIGEALDNCLLLGVTVMTGYGLRQAIAITQFVRKTAPSVRIVWGGWHASLLPEQTLDQSGADFLVIGQGELTIVELAAAVERHETDFSRIPGLAWRREGRVVINEPRALADLNQFPPFPYELLDDVAYGQIAGCRSAGVVTSVGCPFRCDFCADSAVYGSKWTGLSAERTLAYISRLRDEHGVGVVRILDSNFFADWERAIRILAGMQELGVRAQWVNARVDTLLRAQEQDRRLFRETVEFFLVGAESGDDNVLNFVHKGQSVQDIRRLASLYAREGIAINFSFLVGAPMDVPGGWQHELEATLSLADEILRVSHFRHRAQFHIFTPYPGTPLFKKAVEMGFRPPDRIEGWSHLELFSTKLPYLPAGLGEEIEFMTTYVLQLLWPGYQFYQGTNPLAKAVFSTVQAILAATARLRWRHKYFRHPVEFRLVKKLLARRRSQY